MKYEVKYYKWLERVQLTTDQLPEKLKELVIGFDYAFAEWNKAGEDEQQEYLSALEQTDAFIAASIYKLAKKPKNTSVSKAKLLALKAKALQINMND